MSAPTCRKGIYGRQRCGAVLDLGTDGNGRVVDTCPKCARTAAGLCRDCPGRVQGKELWCASCRLLRKRLGDRVRYRDPDERARRNARRRERWREDEEFRERRKARAEEYRRRNADKVKRARRRYLLRQPAVYLETQRRHNANPERQRKKREQALRRYYELHPHRPNPKCRRCGGDTGCAPMPEVMRRIRRGFERWTLWLAKRGAREQHREHRRERAA